MMIEKDIVDVSARLIDCRKNKKKFKKNYEKIYFKLPPPEYFFLQ